MHATLGCRSHYSGYGMAVPVHMRLILYQQGLKFKLWTCACDRNGLY